MTFRARSFLALATAASVAVLAAAGVLSWLVRRQTLDRIQQTLIAETRLAANLIGHHASDVPMEPDREANALGRDIAARVTLIAPDGRVLGDSAEDGPALAAMDNHGTRPEVAEARASGLGVARRYSTTIGVDMLYVAARTTHPSIAVVRLALPLTEINQQLQAIRAMTAVALLAALTGALMMAGLLSGFLGRRVRTIAASARRYASGDLSAAARDPRGDELDLVAQVLDESVAELRRKLAEQARDRARLEAILSGMIEGVLVVDAQGRVQLANEAAREVLKLDISPVGRHYLETIRHPDVIRLLSGALGGDVPPPVELSLNHASERTLTARAAPVEIPQARGAVLVLHDISALRLADRVRRDFVANVSHELRTPLTAIRGYLEALHDEPPDAPTRGRFLDVIARHTARMEHLVRDLLRLARLEAREDRIDRVRIDTQRAFELALADLSEPLQARHQRAEIHVDPGAASVLTDAEKLQAILRNLIDNAVKYGPDGGLIRLAAARSNGQIALSVADEGPGIPEPEQSRIFERFYRVDKARSRDSGGVGLGLSIAKHLAEHLGGSIDVSNQPAGGAVFTLRLP